MARSYTVSFEEVAISAAQDLFSFTLPSPSTRIMKLVGIQLNVSDTTIATAQMFAVRARVGIGSFSAGSGGSSGTVVVTDQGDNAAAFNARTNDTTKATASSFKVVYEGAFHIYHGLNENFNPTGMPGSSSIPECGGGQGIVFELLSTPSGTVHMSGTAYLEEIGG